MTLTRWHSMAIAWFLALVAGLIIGAAFMLSSPATTRYYITEVNADSRYYQTVAVIYEGLAEYYDASDATELAADCRAQADYYHAVAAGELAPPETPTGSSLP